MVLTVQENGVFVFHKGGFGAGTRVLPEYVYLHQVWADKWYDLRKCSYLKFLHD